jgi:hypothetical protein
LAVTTITNLDITKTLCCCGHDRILHAVEREDKICTQMGCTCWNFTTKKQGAVAVTVKSVVTRPTLTKAKSICKCGHSLKIHSAEMQNNYCTDPNCGCWSYNVTNPAFEARWAQLEEEGGGRVKGGLLK